MSPNKIFMFLINSPGRNAKIQKRIAKHIFECFEKKERRRRQKVNTIGLNKLITYWPYVARKFLLFVILVVWK